MIKNIIAAFIGLLEFIGTANAVPTLQLNIENGIYDPVSETIVATQQQFSLYAFLYPDHDDNTLSDTYRISMAVTPKLLESQTSSLGSFKYNGTTVDVIDDMEYGTAPSSLLFPDLPKHGIFDTYFTEISFTFDAGKKSKLFDTQDYAGSAIITPGTGDKTMYYKVFTIDTSKLSTNYAIHFDLYNTKIEEDKYCLERGKRGRCIKWRTEYEYDTYFAPFSHDAQSAPPPVPEPETYALLLAGLSLIGLTARRRKQTSV